MEEANKQKVVIVGAGPVGALAALYAAHRGDNVEVYEVRNDLRDPSTTPLNFTKSINLALSERGINSIRNSGCDGLLDLILEETIPMQGRMIHGKAKDGKLYQESQEYDPHGRYIRAVDRSRLNECLLDSLDKMPNVKLHFNHKFTDANFDSKTAWFEQKRVDKKNDHPQNPTQGGLGQKDQDRPTEISVDFDLLIGADGAHSSTRYHLMKYAQVTYQQEYIDALWCQFRIEPEQPGPSFAISPSHLHIWPGGSFMFIAIPSLDKSFTCTLFAPPALFTHLSENLLSFFENNFPGVCPDLISPEDLQKQFHENPHLPLISIKCSPYHYKSSVVILGDAAHAMVPFYGQGMNSGLEDIRVLFDFLEKSCVHEPNISLQERDRLRTRALEAYTTQRTPDAAAINDLSLRNYKEMRSGVQSPLYRLRKWIEESVNIYFPSSGWKTQYSRVSFENERYSDVEMAVRWQSKILIRVLGLGLAGLWALVGVGLLRSVGLRPLARPLR